MNKIISKLNKIENDCVENLCLITSGKTPSYSDDGKVKVVRSGDLNRDLFIEEDNLLKTNEKEIRFLKDEDILISSIGRGSIGKVNIYDSKEKYAFVSEINVLRKPKINPHYLFIFLRTLYGQEQINREVTGATGQLHLLKSNVKKILIPIAPKKIQDKITEKYLEAKKDYTKSIKLSQEVEDSLLKEIGLKGYKPRFQISFISNYSDVKILERFDAEYFQPKYNEMSNKINKYSGEVMLLKDLIIDIKKGKLLKYSYEKGNNSKPYILIENMRRGKYTLFSEEKGVNCREEDILIVADGENSGFVSTNLKGFVGSTILKISFDNSRINNLCLSEILKVHFEKINELKTGSGVPHLDKNVLLNLEIPLLNNEFQKKLSQKIKDASKLKNSVERLLDEAKKEVEKWIESR